MVEINFGNIDKEYQHKMLRKGWMDDVLEDMIECQSDAYEHISSEGMRVMHDKISRTIYHIHRYRQLTYRKNWESRVVRLAENNIGAFTCLMDLDRYDFRYCSSEEILSFIQTLNLKGSRIWVFYKDVCEQRYDVMEKVWCFWMKGTIDLYYVLIRIRDVYIEEDRSFLKEAQYE